MFSGPRVLLLLLFQTLKQTTTAEKNGIRSREGPDPASMSEVSYLKKRITISHQQKGPEKRGQTPLGSDFFFFFFLLFGPSSVDPGRRARVCECLPEARARMHTVMWWFILILREKDPGGPWGTLPRASSSCLNGCRIRMSARW